MDDSTAAGQADAALPLLERLPRLASQVPRLALARLPTPVERLPFAEAEAWIKRDDVTGTLYGGNKVRKLEFLLAAARSAGAGRLITVGALGSHHALATTIYGVRAGFDVTAVLMPQPLTDHVREVLRGMASHGAEIRLVRSPAGVPAAMLRARLSRPRERTRIIPAGGSDATGTLGYVNAALEFARQCAAGHCPRPIESHVAGGTLGTAVGLAIGFAMAGMPTRIVAHRITSRAITNDRRARRLARQTLALLRRAARPRADAVPTLDDVLARLHIDHGQIGRGYGHATREAEDAMTWFARRTSVGLDLTYTAKAAAGFLAALRARPDGSVVYWHTLSSVERHAAPAPDEPDGLPASLRRLL